jgi:hypothetical protein
MRKNSSTTQPHIAIDEISYSARTAQWNIVAGMSIELNELRQTANYVSPFNEEIHGFNSQWWITREFGRVGSDTYLSFTIGQNEVARAWIYQTPLLASYVDLSVDEDERIQRIYLFEVNESYRRSGIGLQTIGIVCERYSSELIVAFSKDQKVDCFWSKTRLQKYDYTDSDEKGSFMTMFAHDGRPR